MNKILFSLLLILVLPFAANSTELFSPANKLLDFATLPQLAGTGKVLSGEFIQKRQFTGMQTTLISKGLFILDQGQGLLWEQHSPFASQMLMKQDLMVQKMANSASVIISAEQNPLPFTISQVFFELFQGEFKGLSKSFDLYLFTGGASWQLGLKPKSALLKQAIEQIIVTGSGFITRLTITDIRGNHQQIDFEQVTFSETLSQQQLEQFNL